MTNLEVYGAPQEVTKPTILKEPLNSIEDPLLSSQSLRMRTDLPQFIGLSFVWLGGQVTKKLNSGSQTGFGLSYSERDTAEEFWDLQGHWLSSRSAWIQIGKKFLISSDSLYEPYYRLGVSHFLDPDDSLAGLFRMESFKASASFGYMDLFSLGRLLTAEVGIQWGLGGLAYQGQAGLQWNF